MGMPRFQPQTGHGLQNPRQVEVTATYYGMQSIAVPLPGKEALWNHTTLCQTVILDPGIKEPAAGNGGKEEERVSEQHCTLEWSLFLDELAQSGTSLGNVLALQYPPCLIARLIPDAQCHSAAIPHPSSAERGRSSFQP